MTSIRFGTRGASVEKDLTNSPRFAMETSQVPLTSHINVSVPPPPLPFMPGMNPLVALPPPNLILQHGPPPYHNNHHARSRSANNTSENLPSHQRPPPLLLVRFKEKYIMMFNNYELLPQYLIEEDLWHRFGVLSCSVVIKRSPETGAPITDDEVQIHFNELATADTAFRELSNDDKYCDLQFHEECVPSSQALEAIEVSQSLDHFYCLTFRDEGQLNWDVQQLKDTFSNYGHVANVNKDKLGNIYIRYSEKRSAQLALFYLATDRVIQLRNARNLKDKVPPTNKNPNDIKTVNKIDIKTVEKLDIPKLQQSASNTEDDSASTASGDQEEDLSMLEMQTIEDAIMSNSFLLD